MRFILTMRNLKKDKVDLKSKKEKGFILTMRNLKAFIPICLFVLGPFYINYEEFKVIINTIF